MSSGMPFELYMQPTIRKRYPTWDGWEIYEQEKLQDGSIVDFYVVRRNAQGNVDYGIVIDAKDKKKLEPADIDQILHYSRQCGGVQERIIYIANDTDVPYAVQDYADDAQVTITRTQWRSN
jgi:hypothetical protein